MEGCKVGGTHDIGSNFSWNLNEEFQAQRREGIKVGMASERGTKVSGDWFGRYDDMKAAGTISPGRMHGKNSPKRKAASALIAKIPFPLAQHIAHCFRLATF